MIPLVSLEIAKGHLQIVDSERDADIRQKLYQASVILLNYIEEPLPEESSPETLPWTSVPYDIQCACCLMLSEINENREASIAQILSPAVRELLRPYRDPSMA